MTVRSIVDAVIDGRSITTEYVKTITQVTSNSLWFDLTGSSGNPKAKQWFDFSPLTAAQIKQSTDNGLYHGGNPNTGQKKFLRYIRNLNTNSVIFPISYIMCDYLLYYPTIEDSTTDEQIMSNPVALPRYDDGKGVMMMAVTISARTGGQSFTVNYTNQDGVSGRVTPSITQNNATAVGTITTCNTATNGSVNSPFIPLQSGDYGVRSIQSVTMNGVDTGFFAIILVKPLVYGVGRESSSVSEKDFLIHNSEMERVLDDAYLSFVVNSTSNLQSNSFRGSANFIWF